MRAKWGKPAIAGQLPTTGLPTRMRAKVKGATLGPVGWRPTGFISSTESQMRQACNCKVSYLLRSYQLEWELKGATLGPVGWRPTGFISSNERPNEASLQLQVSYLLRSYQLEWELKGATLGPVGWRPTGFISSTEGQMGQACNCRSATYYGVTNSSDS